MTNKNKYGERKDTPKLVDPCAWFRDGIEEINLFFQLSEKEYTPANFNRLRISVEEALRKRDSLSPKEREIVAAAYPNWPQSVRSGKCFEELYQFLESIEDRDGMDEGELFSEYVSKRMGEQKMLTHMGMIRELVEQKEREGPSRIFSELIDSLDSLLRAEGDKRLK